MVMFGKEWQIPIFSEEEGLRRWKKIREMMTAREIDCLIIAGTTANNKAHYADMRYVSNYINWFDDEYCVFPQTGEPSLHVWARQHEYWAEKVSWIKRITTAKRIPSGVDYLTDVAARIKELGLEKATLGLAQLRVMPAYFYIGITRALPKARFVDAGELLRTARIIKSQEELEYVRKSGECADLAFQAMVEAARPGATDYDLAAESERALVKAGAEVGSFTLINSKQWPDGWGFQHGGSNRRLQEGDIILNEITPCYGGYYVQLCRPISLGKPSEDFVRCFDIYKGMYELAAKEFKPGVYLSELDAKMLEYGTSRFPFSHARGGFQLMDSVMTYPFFTGELRPGMTLVNHPYCNPPEAELKAKKGHMGHIIGDTFIITETGAESVSKLPLKITVL